MDGHEIFSTIYLIIFFLFFIQSKPFLIVNYSEFNDTGYYEFPHILILPAQNSSNYLRQIKKTLNLSTKYKIIIWVLPITSSNEIKELVFDHCQDNWQMSFSNQFEAIAYCRKNYEDLFTIKPINHEIDITIDFDLD